MFENFNLGRIFRKIGKTEPKELESGSRESKETAKERLHMVLMQDRANVSADFLELMKQEIIDVIKKYIEVDENTIDVRLTTKTNEDGSNGTPSLYANIPILNIRNDMKVENYKFAIQSDGSIIAEKIEDKEEEKEIDLNSIGFDIENNVQELEKDKNLDVEVENIEKNTDNITTSEDTLENDNIEKIIIEEKQNMDDQIQEIINNIEKIDELKIEERQKDIISEIIPAIENIEKIDGSKLNDEIIEKNNNEENLEQKKEEEEKEHNPILTLKKSARRGRPKKKDKSLERKNKKSAKNSLEEEDDDDVTFDDLLKAAEEEDRLKAEQEKKEDK